MGKYEPPSGPHIAAAVADLARRAREAKAAGDAEAALSLLRAAAELAPGDLRLRTDAATELRELKRFDEALEAFGAIVAEQPDFGDGHYGLGLVLQRLGRNEEALAAFRAAAAVDPRSPWYALEVADSMHRLGRLDEAFAAVQALLEAHPAFIHGHLRLARMQAERGDTAGARRTLRETAEAQGIVAELRRAAADQLRDLGFLDDAEAAYRAVLAQFPRDAEALAGLGSSLRLQGRRDDALAAYRDAGQADPNNPAFANEAATELRELGRIDEALQACAAVLAQHPRFAPAHFGLGLALRRKGDRAAALAAFRAAAELEPHNPWPALEVVAELRAADLPDEAATAALALAQSEPRFARAHFALAQCRVDKGDWDGAHAALRAASDLAADDAGLRGAVAGLLSDGGRWEEAEAAWRQLALDFPDRADADAGLARMFRRKGERQASLEAFARARALAPDEPAYAVEAADELRALGRFDEAAETCKAVLDRRSGHAGALFGLGEALRLQGWRDEALTVLQAAAEADPQNPWIRVSTAALLRDLGRFAEAEAFARGWAAERPLLAQPWIELAAALRVTATAEDALAAARQAAAREPKNPTALASLADEWLRAGETDAAEALYDAALGLAPDSAAALSGKAAVAGRRGDSAKALGLLQAAARASPSPWTYGDLAQAEIDAGALEPARRTLEEGLARHPREPRLLMLVGQIERAGGDPAKAILAFERALAAHPRLAAAQAEIARDRLSLGQTDGALAALADALAIAPDCSTALEILASLLQRADEPEAALAAYRRIDALRPRQLWIVSAIAALETRLGRPEQATAALEAAAAALGPRPDIAAARARLMEDQGLPDEAADLLDRALLGFPDDWPLRRQRVALALQAGDAERARALIAAAPPVAGRAADERLSLRAELAAAELDFEAAHELAARAAAALPADSGRAQFALRAALLAFQVDDLPELLRREGETRRVVAELTGASPKLNMGYWGDLSVEWRIGAAEVAAVRRAFATTGEARARALAAIVSESPDFTPAALALLAEWRRQGRLAAHDEPAAPASSRIPRRVAQFWDRAPPADVLQLCQSWRSRNGDYEHRLFSESEALAFLDGRLGARTAGAFARAIPLAKADIFRFGWLLAEGGVFADVDVRCVGALDGVITAGRTLVLRQDAMGGVGADAIAAAPGSPLIEAMLRQAVEAVLTGDVSLLWASTGGGMMTRVVAEAFARGLDAPALLTTREWGRAVRFGLPLAYKRAPQRSGRAAFTRRRDALLARLGEIGGLAGVAAAPA